MKQEKLGTFVDVVSGVSYSPRDVSQSGIRILRGGNIQNGSVIFQDDDVFLGANYKSTINQIRSGDTIIVASTGSTDALGKAATVWEAIPNVQIGAFLRIARPKEERYAALVSAWLNQPIFSKYIVNAAKGTGINNIRKEHILDYHIELPDDSGLAAFSDLYKSYSQKIAFNRKRIKELEALAKTIYDYWFVQFDFPDKNGKPYRSSGGKMVYNDHLKREIPEGWKVGSLNDIAIVTMGQSPSGNSLNESGNGILFFQGSSDFGDVSPSNRVYTIAPTRVAGRGDVLLSVRAPVGATNIALSKCCIGRGLAALRGRDCSNIYVLQTLSYAKSRLAAKNVDGTIFGSLSKDELNGLEVLKAPATIIQAFDDFAIPIIDQVLGLVCSIREMSAFRDFLLPLLMNGQVKIKEAV